MRPARCLVSLLLLCFVPAAGCLDLRTACEPIGSLTVAPHPELGCPTGFEDLDGDGYGDESRYVYEGDCDSDGVACVGGDCQDRPDDENPFPDRRFPGNLEVCDGIENDCDGGDSGDHLWADAAGEVLVPHNDRLALSCSSRSELIYLAPRESDLLGTGRYDPTTHTLRVPGGTDLGDQIAYRYLRTRSAGAVSSGVIVWSWPDSTAPVQRGRTLFSETGPDSVTCPRGLFDDESLTRAERLEACWALREVSPDIVDVIDPLPDYQPRDDLQEADPNTHYLILLSAGECDPAGLGALSSGQHCTSASTCQDSDCEPVWDDVPNDSDEIAVEAEGWVGPLDAARLTEVDLATCLRFGTAQVPYLNRGTSNGDAETGELCQYQPGVPGCMAHYGNTVVACTYLKVVVTPDDG